VRQQKRPSQEFSQRANFHVNVPRAPPTPFSEILNKLKGKNVLIVTEKPGFARQGSAINFVIVQNKQKFELNKNNAEKYNLKVSTTLVQLGIPVE
jgi:hypothetical protein